MTGRRTIDTIDSDGRADAPTFESFFLSGVLFVLLRRWFYSIRAFLGFRVLKTAAATLAAIYTAMLFGVTGPLGAGLLAILGVDTTRWRGLKTVFARLMASVFALALASVLFQFIGFYIWVVALYILLSFPLLARSGLKDGIVSGSVVVFHLFAKGEVSFIVIWTELQLLFIGLGWATVFNLIYMPKEKKTLERLRLRTEDSFAAVFDGLSRHLRYPETVWAGEELLQAADAIEAGIEAAIRARENRFIPQDEPWLLYFRMRQEQLDSIQLMMESVAFISRKVPQADLLADLFDRLALDVKSEYYEGETERMLESLQETFPRMPLPASRDEFETRAALLQLSRELKRCLAIAKREKRRKSSSVPTVIQ
ncbi:aromatic acid exporter family protein [Cohnella faecalis]|uniref:aromatic acid exporter family protein n=1 Tax=Cohnella faecalis TaxID=2315694 RepID=UPI001F3C58FD|nr:aromatic acid exporter family protein [Cohnella faecalis]